MSRINIPRAIANAEGIDEQESAAALELVAVWQDRLNSNTIHNAYYDGDIRARNLGIAVPENLSWVANSCGWPRLAVDYIANRSMFDGFTCSDETASDKLEKIVRANDLRAAYPALAVSVLKHGCGFLTVTAGRSGTDDPEAVISMFPATAAAATWDAVAKRVDKGLTVVSLDPKRRTPTPNMVRLFLDDRVTTLAGTNGSWAMVDRQFYDMGRPLMEAVCYKPTLEKPFGQTRITKSVRDLTDDCIRASMRAEVAAEFCAAPQKYAMGVEPGAFGDLDKWQASIDRILTISSDPITGEKPTFGQLAQGTMQPNVDYVRTLASRFSAETCIPMSALGAVSDNPASAEAIAATKEDAVIEVNALNARANSALSTVALMALATVDNISYQEAAADLPELSARFVEPATPSVVTLSDAILKQVQAIPWLAESEVVLESLGYNGEQIMRLRSDKRRARAELAQQALITSLMGGASDGKSYRGAPNEG